jgi:hypothetical protein
MTTAICYGNAGGQLSAIKRAAVLVLVLTTVVAAFMFRDRGRPSIETIREIETAVVMPDGAWPMNTYNRYYGRGWKMWTPVVTGVFLSASTGEMPGAVPVPGVEGAYFTDHLPIVADGGCHVVTVHYDETEKALIPTDRDGKQQLAVCNGF